MSKSLRVVPFASGTQYLDWQNRNCCQCALYSDDASKCDLMRALSEGVILGDIPAFVADAIGYPGPLEYSWECKAKVRAAECHEKLTGIVLGTCDAPDLRVQERPPMKGDGS